MGKYRILYPTVTEAHGVKGEAGKVVDLDDKQGAALVTAGAVEPATGGKVERATSAPGEKRTTRIPRKPRTAKPSK